MVTKTAPRGARRGLISYEIFLNIEDFSGVGVPLRKKLRCACVNDPTGSSTMKFKPFAAQETRLR